MTAVVAMATSEIGRRAAPVGERELAVDGIVRFAIHFGVWVHEEIQRWSVLSGGQGQVAATAELQAILVVVSEKVVSFRRVFRRLAAVHWHPAPPFHVKLGPAVVAGDFT